MKGSHATTFAYGADRSRFIRTDSNQSAGINTQTIYVGGSEYHYSGAPLGADPTTGKLEIKRMVAGTLHTLHFDDGSDTTADESLALIFSDHLGSTDAITDFAGIIT